MEYNGKKSTEFKSGLIEGSTRQIDVDAPSKLGHAALEILQSPFAKVDIAPSAEAQLHMETYITFYREIYGKLFRFGSKKLNDTYTVEDLVSETMIIIFRKWDKLKIFFDKNDQESRRRLYGFAFKTMQFHIWQEYNKKSRQVVLPELVDSEKNIVETPEAYIGNWDMESTIQELPLQQERIIGMAMIGASNEEIAQILHITQSSVRSHLARARHRIKLALQDE